VSTLSVASWQISDHRGCIVCSPVVAARHRRNAAAIGRVAASLRRRSPSSREAPEKQETPQVAPLQGLHRSPHRLDHGK